MSYWDPGTEPWKSGTATRGTQAALSFGFRRVGGRREANKIIRSCSGPKFTGFCWSEPPNPSSLLVHLQTPLPLKGPRSQPSLQRRNKGVPLIVCNLTCLQTPWKVLLGLLGVAALVTIITVPVVLLNKGRTLQHLKKRGWLEMGSGGIVNSQSGLSLSGVPCPCAGLWLKRLISL